MISQVNVTINREESKRADEYMLNYLVKAGWFDTREEAKNWAGEVFFEAMLTYLETLGIDFLYED